MVRIAMGHHRMPDADDPADHHGLFLPPDRYLGEPIVSQHPDPSRVDRSCDRDLCQAQRQGPEGPADLKLDSRKEEADVDQATQKVKEIEAQLILGRSDIASAAAKIVEAKSTQQNTQDELDTKRDLYARNPGNVAFREIQRLEVTLEGNK